MSLDVLCMRGYSHCHRIHNPIAMHYCVDTGMMQCKSSCVYIPLAFTVVFTFIHTHIGRTSRKLHVRAEEVYVCVRWGSRTGGRHMTQKVQRNHWSGWWVCSVLCRLHLPM